MRKNPLSRANIVAEDVPVPRCGPQHVIIANRYSLISAGTETASVRRNMKDMVVKAMSDPELRDSVKEMLFKDGIQKTAARVNYETTKWTPMGYSGAGVALQVGRQIDGIAEGDLVAYGGQGHAELIRAEKNLCVPVPEGVTAREASFVALGSIALQATRRAEVQVGDVCAVIGLGLVGQLVSQMLQAAGARVVGSDMIPARLDLARQLGAEEVFQAGPDLPKDLKRYTDGIGVDRAVICASTSKSEVVEQAVAMARDRGRIVVVGMVGLDVPTEDFYHKELDLVISRSYGPGRYDPQYEQHGVDYPIGYVRWTERRNMQEFLRLVQANKVDVKPLVSNEFSLADAADAYEALVSAPGECLAIVLRYDETADAAARTVDIKGSRQIERPISGAANLAVVGCGSFARQFHLPNIQKSSALNLRALVASTGQSAKEMGTRYGAEYCSTDLDKVLADEKIDAVAVFSRDTSHAPITLSAVRAGKHVFCEKPLATDYEQCRQLEAELSGGGPLCMVGFNRRFAPLMQPVKQFLAGRSQPAVIHYRVNAGSLPPDDWVYDDAYAQGRIVGEGCHFVDLLRWLVGADPVRVFAQARGECPSLVRLEDVSATFDFADGSVATLLYTAAGAGGLGKERLEVFAEGTAIALDDYQTLTMRGGRRTDERNRRGDKGHTAELEHFARALAGKEPLSVTHEDGIWATLGCLKIFESARRGEPVALGSVAEMFADANDD